ncbi:MAG: hypothetical protein ACMG55_17650 [Microcoleus sp.]
MKAEIIQAKRRERAKRETTSLRIRNDQLNRAVKALKKLQAIPEWNSILEVKMFDAGLVVRISDKNLKSRVTQMLTKNIVSHPKITTQTYLSAVGELYSAERVDTGLAFITAAQTASDKAKEFYSRIMPHSKYRIASKPRLFSGLTSQVPNKTK